MIQALTTRMDLADGAWFLDFGTGAILLDADGTESVPDDLDDNPRYLAIEPLSSHESFRVMEAFVAGLGDPRIAVRLAGALSSRKPFRRFKDALLDCPAVHESWCAFERKAQQKLAEQWCEDQSIEPQWI